MQKIIQVLLPHLNYLLSYYMPQIFDVVLTVTEPHELLDELLSEEGSGVPQIPAYPSIKSWMLEILLFHVRVPRATENPYSFRKSLERTIFVPLLSRTVSVCLSINPFSLDVSAK